VRTAHQLREQEGFTLDEGDQRILVGLEVVPTRALAKECGERRRVLADRARDDARFVVHGEDLVCDLHRPACAAAPDADHEDVARPEEAWS
jgi:hypothetical protein